MLWTNQYLDQLALEAEIFIAEDTKCIIRRISIPVYRDIVEYQLPDYVNNIRRVFYKGLRLNPIKGSGLEWINESVEDGAFAGHAFSDAYYIDGISSINGSNGRSGSKPFEYYYSTFGENVIRFDPGIDQDIIEYSDGLYDTNIANAVIIEFYSVADGVNFKIPDYIRRRTIKSYVLYKAFAKEGDGQNLQASEYWKGRYDLLLNRARSILNGVYSSCIYSRIDQNPRYKNLPARPVLPDNYGIIVEDDDCWG